MTNRDFSFPERNLWLRSSPKIQQNLPTLQQILTTRRLHIFHLKTIKPQDSKTRHDWYQCRTETSALKDCTVLSTTTVLCFRQLTFLKKTEGFRQILNQLILVQNRNELLFHYCYQRHKIVQANYYPKVKYTMSDSGVA